jgi:putative transposase
LIVLVTRIYRLASLPAGTVKIIRAGQEEAAKVWNLCKDLHLEARKNRTRWPTQHEFHQLTRGRFALAAQSVQQIYQAFLANIESTKKLRKKHPKMKMRYPYREKRFYPILWPRQGMNVQADRLVLPMGRGRSSIVLPLVLPEDCGGCKLVWRDGYELHVSVCAPVQETAGSAVSATPVEVRATVDLGEIHQAAVTTSTDKALMVTGRGIRTIKRQRQQALGSIAKKRSRCTKGSRRYRKLQRARAKVSSRCERRVRDLRHKGTRQVIDFCKAEGVTSLYAGNPHGVRKQSCGRRHNGRLSAWEYGKDLKYLAEKAERAGIQFASGTERGTSSRCPECGYRHKPPGRTWRCKKCGFTGHRDIVGSANMHELAFQQKVAFPRSVTYLRPGRLRRSSSLDTGQSCPGEGAGQPPLLTGSPGSRPNRISRLEARPL